MSFVAAAMLGSAALGAISSNRAAKAQERAAGQAADLARSEYQQTREDQAPFRAGGLTAQNRLMTLLGIGGGSSDNGLSIDPNSPDYGRYGRDFGMSDFQTDPGYAFRLSQGAKALERSAAARGGLISGNTGGALQQFGQGIGSEEYQRAFDRYQVNRSNQLNPLQSLMGAGQSATNFVGSAGQNYASNAGNAYGAGAQARASGYMGMANAFGGGVGQYMGYQQNQATNSLLQQALGRGGSYMSQPYSTYNRDIGLS